MPQLMIRRGWIRMIGPGTRAALSVGVSMASAVQQISKHRMLSAPPAMSSITTAARAVAWALRYLRLEPMAWPPMSMVFVGTPG